MHQVCRWSSPSPASPAAAPGCTWPPAPARCRWCSRRRPAGCEQARRGRGVGQGQHRLLRAQRAARARRTGNPGPQRGARAWAPTPSSRWARRPMASSASPPGAAVRRAEAAASGDAVTTGRRRSALNRSWCGCSRRRQPVQPCCTRSAVPSRYPPPAVHPMLFQHVAIAGLAHIDAPRRLSSDEINARLKPTLDRLGIKTDVLAGHRRHPRAPPVGRRHAGLRRRHAGRRSRRWPTPASTRTRSACWSTPRSAATTWSRRPPRSSAATSAWATNCQNFDVANACLAFLNGMDIASRMIERGEIDYALVVDGETANLAYEKTIERMTAQRFDRRQFRNEMATLTLGSGAAAMVLARAELAPGAPRYRGGVTRAATEWNKLCRGNLDRMVTDTRMLLIEGIKLAQKTFAAARQALGWVVEELDEFVIHQVSKVAHRRLHQGLRHRPEEGPDHLRRARQHRPGLGADRAEQAARDGPPEEGRPRRAARHRLGPELLDGRSGLVSRASTSSTRAGSSGPFHSQVLRFPCRCAADGFSRLPVHAAALRGPPRHRDVVPRRRPARRRSRGHAARQSVVELLLAHAGARAARSLPLHRARPRRHGPVGQAGRRSDDAALRLHAAVARRRPRRAARHARHHRAGDAGGARLGRHDRLRLGAVAHARR